MSIQLANQYASEVLALINISKASEKEVDEKIKNSIKHLSGIVGEKGLSDHFMARLRMEELDLEERLKGTRLAISKSQKVLAG